MRAKPSGRSRLFQLRKFRFVINILIYLPKHKNDSHVSKNMFLSCVVPLTPWLITRLVYRAASTSTFQRNIYQKLVSCYSLAMYHCGRVQISRRDVWFLWNRLLKTQPQQAGSEQWRKPVANSTSYGYFDISSIQIYLVFRTSMQFRVHLQYGFDTCAFHRTLFSRKIR